MQGAAKPILVEYQEHCGHRAECLGELSLGSYGSEKCAPNHSRPIKIPIFVVTHTASSCRDLWLGLGAKFHARLPQETSLKIVYQDDEGDLVLLMPDEPWTRFVRVARRLILSKTHSRLTG